MTNIDVEDCYTRETKDAESGFVLYALKCTKNAKLKEQQACKIMPFRYRNSIVAKLCFTSP